MNFRLFASLLVALVMAGSFQVSTAAKSALFLICELRDRSVIQIVIENFDGMGDAMKQCVQYWRGHPIDFTNDPVG
jgi:hypothetical protein